MQTWARRLAWIAVPLVVVALAAWAGFEANRWALTASGWLAAALAVVGFVHYRTSRDPDVLLLSVAGSVLAVQFAFSTFISGLFAPDGMAVDHRVAGVTALVAGWALAAACVGLAFPWWDRRGRPRLAGVRLAVGFVSFALLIDLLLVIAPPGVEQSPETGLAPLPIPIVGWVWLVLGCAAWLFVGARQKWLIGRGSQHGAIAASSILAIATLVAIAGLSRWTGAWLEGAAGVTVLIPPFAVALLILAVLLMQRSEASRMRRETDRAEEIVEGRAEIASMVAHEVRGPVTTIRGIASTAATHYDRLDDSERREFFELIEQESRRLLAAVDQTSLALRVDAHSLTYTMGITDLAQAVRQGVEKAAVTSHPVHVVAEEGVELMGDRARIAQLVTQLVDNASKFSPTGSPITVRSVRDGEDALIEVDDRGPGIPAEQREAVFGRFVRWRPKGYEEQPGNGLGLFISRGLAAEHQGEISVEDGPGGGTMLRVRLPVGGAARG
jgi:signal transduction histidine kinase